MTKDWNAAYADNETPWDKGYASPPLQEFLETNPLKGRILVPGCGAGHDVRMLGRYASSVRGLDISPLAIKKAESVLSASNESYDQADFLNLPEIYHGQFDVVVEHTFLCAIDPGDREAYVKSLLKALKPGGNYLAVFFRGVTDYSGEGPPYSISSDEIETLFANDFEIIERCIPQETYYDRPVGSEEVCLMRKK